MSSNALAFEVTADSVGFDATFNKMGKTAAGFGNKVSADLKHLVAGVANRELLSLTEQVRDNTATIAEKVQAPPNPDGVF